MTATEKLVSRHRVVGFIVRFPNYADGTTPSLTGSDEIETAQNATIKAREANNLTWLLIARERIANVAAAPDDEALTSELADLAAVCMEWMDCIEKRRVKK